MCKLPFAIPDALSRAHHYIYLSLTPIISRGRFSLNSKKLNVNVDQLREEMWGLRQKSVDEVTWSARGYLAVARH